MSDTEPAARRLSAPLLVGILAAPAVFGLLTLRQGYGRSLRWAVFTYAAVMTGIGALAQLAR